ncbi:MAG: molybdopterin cofactor-binding domain-containing protein, partial [Pseudomonadota bacterium]
RTPATAMRGFGITGVDFSIECHMDRVAEAVGMDPIELRILNAYRDGDMKAHRRSAKNCALIECCQVAAGKSGWTLSREALAASSLTDGGEGWRAEIPATMIDEDGQIGERHRTGLSADPLSGPGPQRTVAAGTANEHPATGAAPQRDDMILEAERLGFKVATDGPSASGPGEPPSRQPPPPTPVAGPPVDPVPASRLIPPGRGGPSLPPAALAAATARSEDGRVGQTSAPPGGAPQAPTAAEPVPPDAAGTGNGAPMQDAPNGGQSSGGGNGNGAQKSEGASGAQPGSRPPRRPGVSRYISGPRGRR